MLLEGKYELDAFVKEGGMGWVYRGKHLVLGHPVAVKLMKPGKNSDHNRIQRFKREAKAVSLLQHPHIVSITDFGQTRGGQLFIVSEFVKGVTLSDILTETGPLPFSRVLRVFAQVMAAVEEAHGNQVIHRDLKPENIMVSTLRGGEDFVKLLDFGIAKVAGASPSLNVTVAGEVCGTPSYMSPEQIRGKPPTTQTDVYALGVLMFELLTGHAPFRGSTVEETLSMHLYEPRPSLVQEAALEDVPHSLERVFQRALAVSPRERFQSVAEMRGELFSITAELPVLEHLPCTACHRPPDSPLGFCSEHCASGFEGAMKELMAQEEAEVPAEVPEEDIDSGNLHLDPIENSEGKILALRRNPTGDIPGVVDTGVRLISLADTLSSWDQLQRLDGQEPAHLVGRRQVLTAIEVFFEDAAGVLEITGAPGAGRSTVLQAASRIASGRDWNVIMAGADPNFALSPLHTMRQILIQILHMRNTPSTLEELRQRATHSGLTQEDVQALMGLFRPNLALEAEDTLVYYEELMASAMRAVESLISNKGPLCVLLDDVTDYDGGSLDFARRLCNAADGELMRVVITSEGCILDDELGHQSLNLPPLNADEVATLAQAAVGQGRRLSHEQIDGLVERTRGNPFHVRQAIRHIAHGAVEEAEEQTLEDLVVSRVKVLSKPAQRLVRSAAVFGAQIPSEIVASLLDEDDELEAAARELMRTGFLRTDTGPELLAFKHETLAKMVHGHIEPRKRAEMHAKALRALEDAGELLTIRARHAYEGMLGRRALNLLERAGDLSMRCRDHWGAALNHYPKALAVCRHQLGYPPDNPRAIRLSLKQARSLRLAGHLLSAVKTLGEVEEAANGNPGAMALIQLEAGRLAALREQPQDARVALNEAIRLSLSQGKPEILMDAYLDLAEAHDQLDDPEAALAELEEGLLMVSGGIGTNDARAPKNFWRLLLGLAERLRQAGDLSRAAEMGRSALNHAERGESQRGRALAHQLLGLLGNETGDQYSAEGNLSTAITLFRRMGDRRAAAECLLLQAQYRHGSEDTLIGQALHLSRQINWADGIDQALRLATPE